MLTIQTEPSLSGSGHHEAMVFRYPLKIVAKWSTPAIASALLLAPMIYFLLVRIVRLITSASTQSNVDKMPFPAITLGIILGSFLLFAGALLVLPYLWSFRIDHEGIAARRLLMWHRIAWKEMTHVERVIENTYNSGLAKIDVQGLRIVGNGTAIKVYDEVRSFELLRQAVNYECHVRGTPMFERDGSWEAVRSAAGQQYSGENLFTGRFFAERSITEL